MRIRESGTLWAWSALNRRECGTRPLCCHAMVVNVDNGAGGKDAYEVIWELIGHEY